MKKLSVFFALLAVALFGAMCFSVGYHYRDLLCGIAHAGFSAPAELAFLGAIPFVIAIVVCIILAIRFNK